MSLLLLPLVFIAILTVLANMGQVEQRMRWWIWIALLLLSLGVTAAGAALFFFEPGWTPQILAPGLDITDSSFRIWLLLSGGLTTLLVLVAIATFLRGIELFPGWRQWNHPVQLTAAVLALLYTGINLAFAALIQDPQAFAESLQIGMPDLLLQNVAFVILSLLGVGLWLRRSWFQAWQRLGWGPLTPRRLVIAVVMAWGLVGLSGMLGGLLYLLSPDAVNNADVLNQVVVGAFASPAGAIALGLITGVGEEILYRGALQPVFGIWLTSLIFAVHHLQYLSPALLLIFGLGLALGWIRRRWNTTTAALVHAIYNTTLILSALAASQVVG